MDLDTALTDKPAEGATATEMLSADHREFSRLFEEYKRARGESAHARKVLAQALCMQLELHDVLEREVFYPALREHDAKTIDAALRDHDSIMRIVDEVKTLADEDQNCDDAVTRLKERVERHVREEEQGLFARVEDKPGESLRDLGAALMKRKEELTRSTESFEGPAT
jgi:hemerythrin superfamily protein